ncbi:copper amine oxidase domain-containing protein [Gottschalkia purinilytica]|uniref:Copper amine oxidase domain-containing protein n=1 Tax=Gottschalkia purinilytica TaxID=1503 RepID=A0A0L0WE49_GOTPU|nr:copper amine oxidase N-terminal domain-containing protein [Gottschalkia purinilytica]KNF09711.1 copper amine oxidase domain-containing protein [Gottschalkia purinilytica]
MKLKRTVTGLLSVIILSLSAATSFAVDIQNLKDTNYIKEMKESMPISTSLDVVKQSETGSVTGKVTKITDFKGVKGSKYVLLENEGEVVANLIVSNDTYVVNNDEVAVGSVITAFYDKNRPMIMIYPPQYETEAIVVNSEDKNVKVDTFDKDLISSDNSLKLNISDDTDIISQDEKRFDGELANRKLVVIYDKTTRSIPAQTTPDKIVVLFEKAVSPIHNLTKEEMEKLNINVLNVDIIVNDKKIEAPAAYKNKDGNVMVPLRAIAEALNVDVSWNNELHSVMLGKGISLKIGEDNYTYMKTAPIQLGIAPELVMRTTFVPLNFFEKVMRMNNVQVLESQIIIDNGETIK